MISIGLLATQHRRLTPLFLGALLDAALALLPLTFSGKRILRLTLLSGRFTMSTTSKNDPIPVDDPRLFFRQIVDSSPALTCKRAGFEEVVECRSAKSDGGEFVD